MDHLFSINYEVFNTVHFLNSLTSPLMFRERFGNGKMVEEYVAYLELENKGTSCFSALFEFFKKVTTNYSIIIIFAYKIPTLHRNPFFLKYIYTQNLKILNAGFMYIYLQYKKSFRLRTNLFNPKSVLIEFTKLKIEI